MTASACGGSFITENEGHSSCPWCLRDFVLAFKFAVSWLYSRILIRIGRASPRNKLGECKTRDLRYRPARRLRYSSRRALDLRAGEVLFGQGEASRAFKQYDGDCEGYGGPIRPATAARNISSEGGFERCASCAHQGGFSRSSMSAWPVRIRTLSAGRFSRIRAISSAPVIDGIR